MNQQKQYNFPDTIRALRGKSKRVKGMLVTYKGKTPVVDETAFVAENATLIGDVTVGPDASVWFGAVVRGDNGPIVIGRGSNVQDNATLHTEPGFGLTVGENVTIGHNAVVHCGQVRDGALIGMGAVVLNEAVVGEYATVGAGAVVKQNDELPPYSLAVGIPAKVIKTGVTAQKETNVKNAAGYVARKNAYMAGK